MQRFLNDPNHYVSDLLSGLYKAHPQCLTHLPEDPFCLHTPWRIPGKVAPVSYTHLWRILLRASEVLTILIQSRLGP